MIAVVDGAQHFKGLADTEVWVQLRAKADGGFREHDGRRWR